MWRSIQRVLTRKKAKKEGAGVKKEKDVKEWYPVDQTDEKKNKKKNQMNETRYF